MRGWDTAFFAFINIKNSTKTVRISLVDTDEGCRLQRIEAFSLTWMGQSIETMTLWHFCVHFFGAIRTFWREFAALQTIKVPREKKLQGFAIESYISKIASVPNTYSLWERFHLKFGGLWFSDWH